MSARLPAVTCDSVWLRAAERVTERVTRWAPCGSSGLCVHAMAQAQAG